MPYNKLIANKIARSLASFPELTKQQKMGGISYMIKGKMYVRAHSDGTMLIRCKPEMTEELLQKKGVKRFVMKNKPIMKGWLLISPEVIENKNDFAYWIGIALDSIQPPSKKD